MEHSGERFGLPSAKPQSRPWFWRIGFKLSTWEKGTQVSEQAVDLGGKKGRRPGQKIKGLVYLSLFDKWKLFCLGDQNGGMRWAPFRQVFVLLLFCRRMEVHSLIKNPRDFETKAYLVTWGVTLPVGPVYSSCQVQAPVVPMSGHLFKATMTLFSSGKPANVWAHRIRPIRSAYAQDQVCLRSYPIFRHSPHIPPAIAMFCRHLVVLFV